MLKQRHWQDKKASAGRLFQGLPVCNMKGNRQKLALEFGRKQKVDI